MSRGKFTKYASLKNPKLILTLFLIGFAFFIPSYVLGLGDKEINLSAKPVATVVNSTYKQAIELTWETKLTGIDKFVIERSHSVSGETYKTVIPLTPAKNYLSSTDKDTFKYTYKDAEGLEPKVAYTYQVIGEKISGGKKITIDSNIIENIILVTAENPHGMYSSNTDLCRKCHAVNNSKAQGLLVDNYDPDLTTVGFRNYNLCFGCHGGSSKTNILKYFNGADNGVNKGIDGENKGHFVTKSGSVSLGLPEGWQLSCTDCHDQHGSINTKLLNESLGDFITLDINGERQFCSSCHAYSDSGNQSNFRDRSFKTLPSLDKYNQGILQHKQMPKDAAKCSSCHGQNGDPVAGVHSPISRPPTNPPPKDKGTNGASPNNGMVGDKDIDSSLGNDTGSTPGNETDSGQTEVDTPDTDPNAGSEPPNTEDSSTPIDDSTLTEDKPVEEDKTVSESAY